MCLLETPGKADAISKVGALLGGTAVALRPKEAQIVRTVTFSCSVVYERRGFNRTGHGSSYDEDGKGEEESHHRHARPMAGRSQSGS